MKIYKVCARIGDKFVSATTHRFGLRSAECEYKIGIPTVPHPDCGSEQLGANSLPLSVVAGLDRLFPKNKEV